MSGPAAISPANGCPQNGNLGHSHRTRDGGCWEPDTPGSVPSPDPPSSLSAVLCWVPKEWTRLRRCLEAVTKGFAFGAARAFLSSCAVEEPQIRQAFRQKGGDCTNDEAVALVLTKALRYGLFLRTFAGTYVSVDELIAAFGGQKRSGRSTSRRHKHNEEPKIIVFFAHLMLCLDFQVDDSCQWLYKEPKAFYDSGGAFWGLQDLTFSSLCIAHPLGLDLPAF